MRNLARHQTFLGMLLTLYSKDWFRAAVRPFLPKPTNKTYVFVIGCYSSGTTLLDNILSAHEEISNLPSEGQVLTGQLSAPEDFGWNRMWCMCQDKLEISKLANKPDADLLKREWSFWFDPKKLIWLEKSIINSLNIDWIEEYFDSPYFIWIVRNGYAVSEGIQRRTKDAGKHPPQYPEGYPIKMCARQWAVSNQVIEDKLASVKYYIKVSYEELTRYTQETINRILTWLPMKNKSITIPLEFTFHKQKSKIRNMNQESIERLSKQEIDSITDVAGEMLKHHGYKIIGDSP